MKGLQCSKSVGYNALTSQATYVLRHIQMRSHNHCCSEKGISITYRLYFVKRRQLTKLNRVLDSFNKTKAYSECPCVCGLSYLARKYAPYYIAICGLSCSTILSHKRHDFRKEVIENDMCFDFLCKLYLKHFSV
jgi:hypothetical protein